LPPAFCIGLLVFLLFVGGMEAGLSRLGYRAVAADSELKWWRERERVTPLGTRALVLIGGSRIQLGLDLNELRARTGLEPVQLAIDGNSFWPTLESLASDERFRGTVLVDYNHATQAEPGSAADLYNRHHDEGRLARPSYWAELTLGDLLRDHMRASADGARPYFSLRAQLMAGLPYQTSYMTLLPDRSRLADYARVPVTTHAYATIVRTMHWNLDPAAPDAGARIAARVAQLAPAPLPPFLASIDRLAEMTRRITSRGGKVIFVVMPTSGLIRQMEQRLHPRETYWRALLAGTGAPGVHYLDESALAGFDAPDSSHLDARDRTPFTRALADILRARNAL
jgi:hypothetical protein